MVKGQIILEKKDRFILGAIIGLLLVIRLVFISFYAQPYDGDSLLYMNISKHLIEYFTAPTTIKAAFHLAPLQSLFLWLIRLIGGDNQLAYGIGMSVLDAMTALIIFRLAVLVFLNKYVGFLAAMGVALYPSFIWHTSLLYSETLFMCMLSLSVFYMTKSFIGNETRYFIMSGITLGLATLTRPVVQLYPFIFIIMMTYVYRTQLKKLVRNCILFLVLFCVTISPVAIRNAVFLKKIVSLSAEGGLFLLYSHVTIAEDNFLGKLSYEKFLQRVADYTGGKDIRKYPLYEQELIYRKIAFELIKKYPGRYIIMCLNRFLRLWFNVGYGYQPSRLAYMVCIGQSLILILFILAYLLFRGKWAMPSLVSLSLIGYFTIVHMAFVAIYRYILPVMPLVIMVASYSICRIWTLYVKGTSGLL